MSAQGRSALPLTGGVSGWSSSRRLGRPPGLAPRWPSRPALPSSPPR